MPRNGLCEWEVDECLDRGKCSLTLAQAQASGLIAETEDGNSVLRPPAPISRHCDTTIYLQCIPED